MHQVKKIRYRLLFKAFHKHHDTFKYSQNSRSYGYDINFTVLLNFLHKVKSKSNCNLIIENQIVIH